MTREKIIDLIHTCAEPDGDFGIENGIAFYHAAQAEAFEAVIENLNPKHYATGAMYQSTIAAIREMAKEKQNAD